MKALTDIFSLVCGQGRCFAIDGAELPVCQRCFGLYLGAVLTAIWLLASGIWRRGLPGWSVLAADVVVLTTAMLGGIHVLDAGPTCRLVLGLWAGHVAMLWLVGGGGHLWRLSRPTPPVQLHWRRGDKVQGLAAVGVLAALAASFGLLARLGWHVWAAAVGIGAISLLIAAVLAMASLVLYVAAKGSVLLRE